MTRADYSTPLLRLHPGSICFHAPGRPKPQPRPRAFARGGHARVYNPSTAEGWKGDVVLAAREHIPTLPIEGPVEVELIFVFQRPKAHYGTGRNAGVLKIPHRDLRHAGGVDVDNLAKAVLDCLTDLRFWLHDGQVWRLVVEKRWESDGVGRGCRVTIRPG